MNTKTDRQKAEVLRVQELRRSSASRRHRNLTKYTRKTKYTARRYDA